MPKNGHFKCNGDFATTDIQSQRAAGRKRQFPDRRPGLSRWRGGRYRVVGREISDAADVEWVTEKGNSYDPFTKNDAGRTPAP